MPQEKLENLGSKLGTTSLKNPKEIASDSEENTEYATRAYVFLWDKLHCNV